MLKHKRINSRISFGYVRSGSNLVRRIDGWIIAKLHNAVKVQKLDGSVCTYSLDRIVPIK